MNSSLSRQTEKAFYDEYSKVREIIVKSIRENVPLYEKFSLALQLVYCLFFLGILVDKKIIQEKNQKKFSRKILFSTLLKDNRPYQQISNLISICNSNQVFQYLKLDDLLLNLPFLNLDFFKDFTIEKFEQINLNKRNWSRIFNFINKYLNKIDFLESDFFGTIIERDLTLLDAVILKDISENNLTKIISKMNDRKKFGVYYTPKEVSRYMVKKAIYNQLEQKLDTSISDFNSIINLLSQNDLTRCSKILSDIRILDPALGSGEFLLETANELLQLKIQITKKLGNSFDIQKYKFNIIEKNLFGVDIQEISIKISKLKLWLWYIQDLTYENLIPSTQRLLPNLFQNLLLGNSLVGFSFEKIPEQRYDYYIQPEIYILINSHLMKLQRSLANYSDVMILNNIIRIYTILKSMDFEQTIFTNQDILMRLYISIERALIELPFSKVFSRELFGFFNEISHLLNVLIKEKYRKQLQDKSIEITRDELRNRIPFNWNVAFRMIQLLGGFDIIIGNPPYIENKKIHNKQLKSILKISYKTAYKLYDMAILFIEQAFNLLKESGTCSYIITNKFLTTDYGIKIRELLLTQTKLDELIDVSHIPVFYQTATYPIILTFKKSSSTLDQDNLTNDFTIVPKIADLSNLEKQNNKITLSQQDISELPNKIFDISGHFDIIKKITTNPSSKKLSEFGTFNYRIFGFTDWQDYLSYIVKNRASHNDLRFIGTANVNPYIISFSKPLKLSSKEIIESYISYSDHFEEKWQIFRKPKLLIREIAKHMSIAYDPGFYANLTGLYMFIPNNCEYLKPLIVILNSALLDFYYSALFGTTHLAGNYLRYNGSYLKELPVIIPKETHKQKCLSKLMDYQSFLLQINEFEDNQDLESINKILHYFKFFNMLANCLVYELYFNEELKSNLFGIINELIYDIPFDEWYSKIQQIEMINESEISKLQKEIWSKIRDAYSILRTNEIKKEITRISSHQHFILINSKIDLDINSFF